MPFDYLVSALVTLLVVVDPVGLAPIFLAVTYDLPAPARRRIAVRSSIIAGAILAGTALVGNWLLGKLGITLPAFRIAGGLLLFAVASEMVFGVRIERQSKQAEEAIEEHVRNIAAFPLAIPLMAGPGAITATLLLAGQAGAQPLLLAILLGVVVMVMAACLAIFLWPPTASTACSALPVTWSCRVCSASSWPHSRCSSSSTACVRCLLARTEFRRPCRRACHRRRRPRRPACARQWDRASRNPIPDHRMRNLRPPLAPARSSIVRVELKPCRTISVE